MDTTLDEGPQGTDFLSSAIHFSALTATQYVALHFHCLISLQGVVLNLKLEHLLALYTTF
jgi:hypothetical protein